MRSLPPLTALRAFEAAARKLSFKDAADELGLTPTAISHQIRLLEQYCGSALFRRRPRPLALTAQGAQLYPAIRDGFDRFAEGLAAARTREQSRLKVTATNAFAARRLVPCLPSWLATHPTIGLDIVGTDAVLDLDADDADVAIRYARIPPTGYVATELARDTYYVVGSPKLVGAQGEPMSPRELATFPLIDSQWPADAPHPPMWREWVAVARAAGLEVPDLAALVTLRFQEDLHGIEATIAGQGIAICSDILTEAALADGSLVRVSPISLLGYGFYSIHRPTHPKSAMIRVFDRWLRGLL
jgi:LysR family glycine cleavage system transcriptional activator